MDINEMTVEQIEVYLKERKTPRKGELGGVMMRADEVELGETVWLKCVKQGTGNIGALFTYEFEDDSNGIRIYNQALVETNVPTPTPARRRMTAAEAAEHLQLGQEVWVKCRISITDADDKHQPVCVEFGFPGSQRWLLADTEIEVDA